MLNWNRHDKGFVRKAQTICKMFRNDICNITLQEMADLYEVNLKSLSAWECGRSNKVEYLFYYYDLLGTECEQKWFIDAVFNSDNKKVVIDTSRDTNGEVVVKSVHIH